MERLLEEDKPSVKYVKFCKNRKTVMYIVKYLQTTI